MTVVVPDRVGEDVGGIHRLPSIDGGAAGCALRGNRHWPYLGRKVGKTGCRGAAQILSVLVRKPDRAEHAIALGFDQPGDDRQNLRQRRSHENQVQNAEYGLGVHGDSRRSLLECFAQLSTLLRVSPGPSYAESVRDASALSFYRDARSPGTVSPERRRRHVIPAEARGESVLPTADGALLRPAAALSQIQRLRPRSRRDVDPALPCGSAADRPVELRRPVHHSTMEDNL